MIHAPIARALGGPRLHHRGHAHRGRAARAQAPRPHARRRAHRRHPVDRHRGRSTARSSAKLMLRSARPAPPGSAPAAPATSSPASPRRSPMSTTARSPRSRSSSAATAACGSSTSRSGPGTIAAMQTGLIPWPSSLAPEVASRCAGLDASVDVYASAPCSTRRSSAAALERGGPRPSDVVPARTPRSTRSSRARVTSDREKRFGRVEVLGEVVAEALGKAAVRCRPSRCRRSNGAHARAQRRPHRSPVACHRTRALPGSTSVRSRLPRARPCRAGATLGQRRGRSRARCGAVRHEREVADQQEPHRLRSVLARRCDHADRKRRDRRRQLHPG